MSEDMKRFSSSTMFAINDTFDGHNVPSLSLGETAEGMTLWAKAVFADELSANSLKDFMNKQAGHESRFEVVMVEIWRPTDIELHVRNRIREAEKKKEDANAPKLILPNYSY